VCMLVFFFFFLCLVGEVEVGGWGGCFFFGFGFVLGFFFLFYILVLFNSPPRSSDGRYGASGSRSLHIFCEWCRPSRYFPLFLLVEYFRSFPVFPPAPYMSIPIMPSFCMWPRLSLTAAAMEKVRYVADTSARPLWAFEFACGFLPVRELAATPTLHFSSFIEYDSPVPLSGRHTEIASKPLCPTVPFSPHPFRPFPLSGMSHFTLFTPLCDARDKLEEAPVRTQSLPLVQLQACLFFSFFCLGFPSILLAILTNFSHRPSQRSIRTGLKITG